jgi:hypothetical protein
MENRTTSPKKRARRGAPSCSVLLPDDTYKFLTSNGSGDPCSTLLNGNPVGTSVTGAGIFDMNGTNNAMLNSAPVNRAKGQ